MPTRQRRSAFCHWPVGYGASAGANGMAFQLKDDNGLRDRAALQEQFYCLPQAILVESLTEPPQRQEDNFVSALARHASSLTKKDSMERSAPRMLECKQDVTARSLNAIGRWTSPGGLPCLLLFISFGSNRLRRMTAMPNSGTEPSMAKASWPVQSALYGRIGHATPCREAAQSNGACPAGNGRVAALTGPSGWSDRGSEPRATLG